VTAAERTCEVASATLLAGRYTLKVTNTAER